jgi:hypothetical protein
MRGLSTTQKGHMEQAFQVLSGPWGQGPQPPCTILYQAETGNCTYPATSRSGGTTREQVTEPLHRVLTLGIQAREAIVVRLVSSGLILIGNAESIQEHFAAIGRGALTPAGAGT